MEAPASRAGELVAQVAAAVEGLSAVSPEEDWTDRPAPAAEPGGAAGGT